MGKSKKAKALQTSWVRRISHAALGFKNITQNYYWAIFNILVQAISIKIGRKSFIFEFCIRPY